METELLVNGVSKWLAQQIVMDPQRCQTCIGHRNGAGMMKPVGYKVGRESRPEPIELLPELHLFGFNQYLRNGEGH